ncbi:MAG: AI-2E family transporter [Clostridium butyricum]|nr:AI-2E family transporter [Clostridium butyricum]
MLQKKHKTIIITSVIFILSLSLMFLYLFNDSVKSIANIIIVSFILSYVLMPVRDVIEEKFKIGRKVSAIIIILLILVIVIGFIVILVPTLFNEISNISNIFDGIGTFLENLYIRLKLNDFPVVNDIYNRVIEKGNYMLNEFSTIAIDNILTISNNIISLAVIPVITYYFLSDGRMFFNKCLLIFPAEKRGLIKKIISDIDKVLSKYIAGQFLLCIIIGVLTFLLLIIFKVKFPLWISLLNAAFNIIPYFGPIFGAIPAIVVAFVDSPIKGLYIILGMIIIQQLEGNILSPKITGNSINMHPFIIIILLIIGDKFGGFMGMILVVPIAVIIKVLYDDVNYYLF